MTGRQQGLVRRPSHANSRDRRDEFGYDQQRHDARDEQPLRYQKSLISHHHTVEEVGRNREREIPSDLLERREHEWHMRRDQGNQVHSRLAPPMERSEKRPCGDEMVLHMSPTALDAQGGYDYAEYEDYNDETIRKPKHGYGYDDRIQISKQEYSERRFLVDNDHGNMAKNVVPVEDRVDSRPLRLYQDRGHGQSYRQSSQGHSTLEMQRSEEPDRGHGESHGQSIQSHSTLEMQRSKEPDRGHGQSHGQSSQSYSTLEMQRSKEPDCGHGQSHGQSSQSYSTLEMQRSKEENDHYQEVMSPEKLYAEKYYKDKEKHLYQSRKFAHPLSPMIQYEDTGNQDFGNHHLLKGTSSTSLGVVRDDFPIGFRDVDIQPFDGYPRKPEKLSETLGTEEYGQRPHLEPRKDYEAGYADMKYRQCNPYRCTWNEHEDYAYFNVESRGKDDPGYISRDALYREDCVHAQADSKYRYIQRPSIAKPFTESPTEVEGSHRIYIDNGLREFDISQKEVPRYVDLRGAIDTSMQESVCLDSGYAPAEFARRASQDLRHHEARVLHEHEMCAYDHDRYVKVPRTQGERVKSSPELVDPVDVQRLVGRENRCADERVAYNRMVKRKYLQDGGGSGFSLGTMISHKWNRCGGSQQMRDCKLEQINISSSGLHSKVPSAHEPDLFSEAKDMMDEIYRHKHSARYGLSDRGKWENMQGKSVKSFDLGRKYMKVHAKSESAKCYGRSHYINHRSDRYKQHYVGKRSEDDIVMDVVEQDGNLSEDPKGYLQYNLHEDSEGFKQSVLAAFLMYSKKLNENPPIKKLYKEQGNSGALFCIVCGRSASKVFRDTEGLARHAFMSHKASLRAQHLGLHRAICVLMGWNTEVTGDTVTWAPLALPQPEAMAQKENLIVWHPTVIVHNISLSDANHKEWKVISLEALEDIVRAKSFIRSRIKICLGYPGDQSVMLVKFLGTFTGMQEAEKLHKYFAEKGRGRAEFERAISNMSKSNDPVQRGVQEETKEEALLYGYMGIVEDLDRVDFDTKKRCQIKSKKEIQDIADAPLKTE